MRDKNKHKPTKNSQPAEQAEKKELEAHKEHVVAMSSRMDNLFSNLDGLVEHQKDDKTDPVAEKFNVG